MKPDRTIAAFKTAAVLIGTAGLLTTAAALALGEINHGLALVAAVIFIATPAALILEI